MDTIEKPMDNFQTRPRTAMQMRNMSVSTLSSKSGISQNTIYIYLNPEKYHRESCPGSNNLEALAEALDVSMDWLWGRQVALMRWIPTSERLPEKGGEYLVSVRWYREDDVDIDVYDYDARCKEWNDGESCGQRVIAWMPLPTPYTK